MNTILILAGVLLLLMMIVQGERGVFTFFTLLLNFIILFIMILLISARLDPIKVTITVCIVISCVSLLFINGFNIKTVSSLISVILVVLATMLLTTKIGADANIQGFGNEQLETIVHLSPYVQVNFGKIAVCQILIGLLGAIIDVSISISSSMFEIYKADGKITVGSLLKSGMNVGKDILGTMTNTLLFAYLGGSMTFIIYLNALHYKVVDILNSKVFCAEIFQILCGGIGIILIIPVTALITSRFLFIKASKKKYKAFG